MASTNRTLRPRSEKLPVFFFPPLCLHRWWGWLLSRPWKAAQWARGLRVPCGRGIFLCLCRATLHRLTSGPRASHPTLLSLSFDSALDLIKGRCWQEMGESGGRREKPGCSVSWCLPCWVALSHRPHRPGRPWQVASLYRPWELILHLPFWGC